MCIKQCLVLAITFNILAVSVAVKNPLLNNYKRIIKEKNASPHVTASVKNASEITQNRYYPQVEYPSSVLDTKQPFFFKASDYDPILSAFDTDVKAAFQACAKSKASTHSENGCLVNIESFPISDNDKIKSGMKTPGLAEYECTSVVLEMGGQANSNILSNNEQKESCEQIAETLELENNILHTDVEKQGADKSAIVSNFKTDDVLLNFDNKIGNFWTSHEFICNTDGFNETILFNSKDSNGTDLKAQRLFLPTLPECIGTYGNNETYLKIELNQCSEDEYTNVMPEEFINTDITDFLNEKDDDDFIYTTIYPD